MKNTVRIDPVGFEEEDDIFEDASEQAFINPEEEFYEGVYNSSTQRNLSCSRHNALRHRSRSAAYSSPQVSN